MTNHGWGILYMDSDEKLLLTGSWNDKICLWNIMPQGGITKVATRKFKIFNFARLFPDFVITGAKHSVNLRSRTDLSFIATIKNPGSGYIEQHSLAMLDNGNIIMRGPANTLRVFSKDTSTENWEFIQTLNIMAAKGDIISLYLFNDQRHLAVGYQDGGIQILGSNTRIIGQNGPTEAYTEVALYTTSETKHGVETGPLQPTPYQLEFDSKNKLLIARMHQVGTVIYQLSDRSQLKSQICMIMQTGEEQFDTCKLATTSDALYFIHGENSHVSVKSFGFLKEEMDEIHKGTAPLFRFGFGTVSSPMQ